MRQPVLMASALGCFFAFLGGAHSVSAQDVPRYDVDAYCEEIASFTGEYSASTDKYCFEAEQKAYNELRQGWGGIPAQTRRYCDEIATFTGQGSYETLAYCIDDEMASSASNSERSFDWGDGPATDEAGGGAQSSVSPSGTVSEGHANALHHLASARALAHLCPVMEVNSDYFETLAVLVGVDLAPGGPDFSLIDEDMGAQIAELRAAMEEYGEDGELIICAVAQNLYGKTGDNVANLLRPVQ